MEKIYLLFPGRHILFTRFQEQYLWEVLNLPVHKLDLYGPNALPAGGRITDVIFAVTSANQANSRYNPLEFHQRSIGIDRFFEPYRRGINAKGRIIGIPHFAPTSRYADILIKEVAATSGIGLTPENTIVLCSTESLIGMFASKGFSVLTGEYNMQEHRYENDIPNDVIKMLTTGAVWKSNYAVKQAAARPTLNFWNDYPSVTEEIKRIWDEPLLTDSGSLTEHRNYSAYVAGMNNSALIKVKFNDIEPFILPGKIADEGCADGALLSLITQRFPDSDHYGIEITSEFYIRCKEQERMGAFGQAFIFFYQKNLMKPIFEANSINTTICNSTTHELYSYNDRLESLRQYLTYKYEQTAPGGHLIIRDVVGPEDKDELVWMWLNQKDGRNDIDIFECPLPEDPLERKTFLEGLSTYAKFYYFAKWYLKEMRDNGRRGPESKINFHHRQLHGKNYIVLSRKDAAEFISKKDYADNFLSEMNEEFTFLSFTEWKNLLQAHGFSVVENPNEPMHSSRTYLNDWIVDNRYRGKVELFEAVQGDLVPTEFPPTNMILVGKK